MLERFFEFFRIVRAWNQAPPGRLVVVQSCFACGEPEGPGVRLCRQALVCVRCGAVQTAHLCTACLDFPDHGFLCPECDPEFAPGAVPE